MQSTIVRLNNRLATRKDWIVVALILVLLFGVITALDIMSKQAEQTCSEPYTATKFTDNITLCELPGASVLQPVQH